MGAGPGAVSGPGQPRARTRARTHARRAAGLTAEQGQAGLEAIAGALQPQLVVHLRVDVLQRRQRGAVRVAVVPAHQGQAPQKQALVDLGAQARLGRAGRRPGALPARACARTPASFHPPVRPAVIMCLLCTRPGDTAVTKTDPAPTLHKKMHLSPSKGNSLSGGTAVPLAHEQFLAHSRHSNS